MIQFATGKVRMTFEIDIEFNLSVSNPELKAGDFNWDVHSLAESLFRNHGLWWGNGLRLVKTEIL